MGERRFLDEKALSDPAMKLLSPAARYVYLALLMTSPGGRVTRKPEEIAQALPGVSFEDWSRYLDELAHSGLLEVRPRSIALIRYKVHMRKPRLTDYGESSCAQLSPRDNGASMKVSYESNRLAWNKLASQYGFPQVRDMTDQRKVLLRKALADVPDLWVRVGAELAQISDFVLHGAWFSFDWLMRKTNRLKLLEGNYRRRDLKSKAETEIDRILGELEREKTEPEAFF